MMRRTVSFQINGTRAFAFSLAQSRLQVFEEGKV